MPAQDLLLQNTFTTEPHQLEVFVNRRRANEHHFYCHGLSVTDFASVFRHELRDMTVLVYRTSPSVLNPNYWEPYSEGLERELYDKTGGAIVKSEGQSRYLWRSDHIAKGRHFRDDLQIDAIVLPGLVFRVKGDEFLRLSEAMRDSQDDVAFVAISKIFNGQDRLAEVARRAHEDVAALTLSLNEERVVYLSQHNHMARVVFASEDHLRKALEAAVRGFCVRIAQAHVSFISRRVMDHLIEFADKTGFLAYPEKDFVDKGRTFEVTLHLGKSEWPPEEGLVYGDEKLLLYYDRTSGIWAVQY